MPNLIRMGAQPPDCIAAAKGAQGRGAARGPEIASLPHHEPLRRDPDSLSILGGHALGRRADPRE